MTAIAIKATKTNVILNIAVTFRSVLAVFFFILLSPLFLPLLQTLAH